MRSVSIRSGLSSLVAGICLLAMAFSASVRGQVSSSNSQQPSQSTSSSGNQFPDDTGGGPQGYAREKTPTLVDPAGPTISLISPEPVFIMAAGLNMCGYDDGLDASGPMRKQVRDEVNKALRASEDARKSRDALCLYVAQHRMTG